MEKSPAPVSGDLSCEEPLVGQQQRGEEDAGREWIGKREDRGTRRREDRGMGRSRDRKAGRSNYRKTD